MGMEQSNLAAGKYKLEQRESGEAIVSLRVGVLARASQTVEEPRRKDNLTGMLSWSRTR